MKFSPSKDQISLLRGSLSSLGLILAGLILVWNPDFGSAAVASLIGWGLLALGVTGIVAGLASWPVLGLPELIVSGVGLILGIYLLNHPLALATLLGFALGVYLLATGLGSLGDARKLHSIGANRTPSLILGAVQLALGIALFLSPRSASRLVLTLCGLAMLVCGILRLAIRASTYRALTPKNSPDILDMEE